MCSSAQRGRDAVALAGSETGTAHGRGGPYRVECRFSLRFCGFLIYVKASCRAPMCAQGGSVHMGARQPVLTIRAEPWNSNENWHSLHRIASLPCANRLHTRLRRVRRIGLGGGGVATWRDSRAGVARSGRSGAVSAGLRVPRSGIAVGSPPGCCRVGSQQTGMLTQSPSRTLVRAQGPGDCGSVSQHCPSDLGPLRAPGSVAPGRAGRSGLRGALRGAAESGVDEDEDEDEDQDRTPDGDGQDG